MAKPSKQELRVGVAAILAEIIYGPGIQHDLEQGDEENVRKGKEEAIKFAAKLVGEGQ